MNSLMKKLLVSGGAMATMAVASSTVVFAGDTAPQPWTAGQVVDVWAASLVGSASLPSSIVLYLNSFVTATRITIQPDSKIPEVMMTEYQFTVPNLGTKGHYLLAPPLVLFSGPSILDTMVAPSVISYVPPISGQLPEVPFAGALPFVALASAGALIVARKLRNGS